MPEALHKACIALGELERRALSFNFDLGGAYAAVTLRKRSLPPVLYMPSTCSLKKPLHRARHRASLLKPRRNNSMKPSLLNRLMTLALALAALGATAAWAQNPSHTDHIMVAPADLKWADVPSLPAGVKVALIEGPLNEAVPFTFRLKFPANYELPAHWYPAIEHVTVISGTFNMGTGDKVDMQKTKALTPGQRRNHATQDQSLRLDWRGNRNPGSRRWLLGDQLRGSRG
jgi:hypothetical protein